MKQLFLICSSLVLLFTSCDFETGSGKIVTEKRNTGSFTRIESSAGIDVEVTMGSTSSVEVEADDNVIAHIITDVNGSTLNIHLESRHGFNNAHMKVLVTTPVLKGIKASSSSDIIVKGVIKDDGKISFDASSSADITAEVEAPEVSAEASSSATITLKGRTKNYTADASSSADIKSEDLLSENAKVTANSSGSVDVYASVTLDADASSSADITYSGGATVTSKTNSSGSVEKK
ncbi:MAG: DUF2807 domain-containing protein [Bacteroidetes bacterium]|nr:DUF2807 domain-containing protein [Bacteroidota bacterium]